MSSVLNEDLSLRTLLEVLLGPQGKRRLRLRNLPNAELSRLYDSKLLLRLHNLKNLSDTRKILLHFKEHRTPQLAQEMQKDIRWISDLPEFDDLPSHQP